MHTTVNCKTKTMAVFLAGGNEGPGKLCCSEQRDNSSHSPVDNVQVAVMYMWINGKNILLQVNY